MKAWERLLGGKARGAPEGTQTSPSFTRKRRVFLSKLLLTAAVCANLPAIRAQAQYTFGPQFQTTSSANITYDPAAGLFQYTNPNSVEDFAGLPLSGNAANLVTNSTGWTVSINVNIAARSMGGVANNTPFVFMGLGVYSSNVTQNRFIIEAGQINNTAGNDNGDVPNGFYGTVARSSALTNGSDDVVTPLGNSQGIPPVNTVSVYSILSGTTGPANTPVNESFGAMAGVLTLSYNASTKTLTGYYNGAPVASYAATGWGTNPQLTLAVFGTSEEGAIVPANTDTASNLNVAVLGQYAFGSEFESTPSAVIVSNLGTGEIEYIDAATATEDFAYSPLTGTAATVITTSNGWTASLTANIEARTMTVTSGKSAHVVMGFVLLSGAFLDDAVFIWPAQDNNTGGGDDPIYPNGWYGTAVRFGAFTNGNPDATTPLGTSQPSGDGSVYLQLSGATNGTAGSEPFSNVTGVVTLSYNAATSNLTGYFNGNAVGSYSLARWGANPALTLAVWGGSGSGVEVPPGTDTAVNFSANTVVPPLILSAPQVSGNKTNFTFLLSGPSGSNFVLQASTNLLNWSPVSTSTIPVGGLITLSNATSGSNRRFYRANLQ